MRVELTGPEDDPQVRITMDLREAYQVQAGMAPNMTTPPAFDRLERYLFRALKKARKGATST